MADHGEITLPLWQHQVRAVDIFERYLNDTTKAGAAAALVSMPTGTGKTAVIAHLVTSVGDLSRDVIILTPWKGLSKQLLEDLTERQWANLGVSKPAGLSVRHIPSTANWLAHLQEKPTHRRVWIGTISKVLSVWRKKERNAEHMEAVFKNVEFAVIDECHYEPAESWSQAIQAMKLRTCLLTATPFRNDNRHFDISPNNNYRYSHREAEDGKVLRRPIFDSLGPSADTNTFTTNLLAWLEKNNVTSEERVLIRCDRLEDVRDIVTTLNERGETAIGFHHQFSKSGDANLRVAVPAPSDRPLRRFWVHQHKLSEGFDDPNLRILAFYKIFSNDRSMVQQIGRVLRNPKLDEPAPALVVAPDITAVRDTWKRYLAYDLETPHEEASSFPAVVGNLLKNQPNNIYWSGQFRPNVDLESPELWQEFKYSTNVRVWRDERKTRNSATTRITQEDFELLIESITLEWRRANRLVFGPFIPEEDPKTRVIGWVGMTNSQVLRQAAHVETRLGYTALVWHDGFIFYSDSDGSVPRLLAETFNRPQIASLHRTMPEDAVVTSVSLINSDLGRDSIRSRSLRARDLNNVASEIGESTYAWSNAQAFVSDSVPRDGATSVGDESARFGRYVGTKNSRIHDYRADLGPFEEFHAWVRDRAYDLNSTAGTAPSLGRYATEATIPRDTTPLHVLLDLNSDQFKYFEAAAADELVLENSGGEVDATGNFSISVNNTSIAASINWDSDKLRYHISSPDLNNLQKNIAEVGGRGVLTSINSNQSFRVATPSGSVYSHGHFWSLDNRRTDNDGILGVLTAHADLGSAFEEKGNPTSLKGWPSNSVFGIIETKLVPNSLNSGSPFLICTDLGAEIADFIAYDDSTVAFIHAKATKKVDKDTKVVKGSDLSASAFHEVASQAIKNLRYLTLGNKDVPKTDYWSKDWTHAGHSTSRIRMSMGTPIQSGSDIWKAIDRRIQSHGYQREVWVVAGASLSLTKLKVELAKKSPEPHAAQAYVLLTGLWSTAQQCGIRLRVFCSP